MNNNNDVFALNEAVIDNYMLDIIECSNKVKAIFNKIDDLVEKLKTNYVCESATTLFKQYDDFNDNYSIVVNNILSYNTDLMSLKKKYVSALNDLTQKMKSEAVRLQADKTDGYKEER